MFPSLGLSLKPEGGFYHGLNVGHRRKEREEVSGGQKQPPLSGVIKVSCSELIL
jgi:hypothetical protein